jgi:hypothetical protein
MRVFLSQCAFKYFWFHILNLYTLRGIFIKKNSQNVVTFRKNILSAYEYFVIFLDRMKRHQQHQ